MGLLLHDKATISRSREVKCVSGKPDLRVIFPRRFLNRNWLSCSRVEFRVVACVLAQYILFSRPLDYCFNLSVLGNSICDREGMEVLKGEMKLKD